MRVTFAQEGDWEKMAYRLSKLGYDINFASGKTQKALATKLRQIVVGHLKKQDIPGWDRLSREYKRRKVKEGYDPRMLIRTQEYVDSIETFKSGKDWVAGVKRGKRYANGNEIADIGIVHEVWSTISGKPFRPLWVPSIHELVETKIATNMIIKSMVSELRARGHQVYYSRFKI